MEVNVYEYANPGHFTLVDSVGRIFSASTANKVNLYLGENHLLSGKLLVEKLQRNNIKVNKLEDLKDQNPDLQILITPDHDLDRTISLVNNVAGSWLFIHNIDDWFDLRISKVVRQVKDALLKEKNVLLAYYLVKRAFIGNKKRKKITETINRNQNSSFVVLNETLKKELAKSVDLNKIKIIPFSLYDPQIKDERENRDRIRICIPGILSQKRRDYLSIFQLLRKLPEDTLKAIEIDLLGGISKTAGERSQEVVQGAKELINEGFPIILREKEYIHLDEFDLELGMADIILGNINLDQGGGSHYGKTKESGIPFTMIRAAKPGILPLGYNSLSELNESIIYFQHYSDLEAIFNQVSNRDSLNNLKEKANLASQKFLDINLFNQLDA